MPRTPSANRQNTREILLDAGIDIVLEQGFNHTGIEAVLKKVGVPKGSFYYYFSSKEDFGFQLIQHYAMTNKDIGERFLDDPKLTPLNRLRQYFGYYRDQFDTSGCRRGCLFGNLGQEMSDQNEGFRTILNMIFGKWRDHVAACIRAGQEQGEIRPDLDPVEAAEFGIATFQGALLKGKIAKSAQPVDTFIQLYCETLLKA